MTGYIEGSALFGSRFLSGEFIAGNASASRWGRLIVVSLAVMVAWVVGAWFFAIYHYDKHAANAVDEAAREAEHQAGSIGAGLDRMLAVRRGIAITLAEDGTIRHAASERLKRLGPSTAKPHSASSHPPEIVPDRVLNRFLASAEQHLKLDALWVGDAIGYGIAAQSADPQDSPIGIDYSDRIYFREAKAGRIGYQYAVGRTTGVGGIYFSAPIRDHNRFAGFVLAKTNIFRLAPWVDQADTLLSDTHGVVVLASNRQLEMRTLPGTTVDQLGPAERRDQYAQMEFRPLDIAVWPNARYPGLKRIEGGTVPVLMRSNTLPEFGLTVTVMRPVPELASIDHQRMLLFLSLAGLGVLGVAIVAVSTAYLRQVHGSRRLLAHQKQQLDQAQELAHLGSWEYDLVQNNVTWSEESRRMFELPAGRYNSTYEKFLTTIHPGDREMVHRTYRDSVAERTPGEIVHRLLLPSGQVKFVLQRWQTQYDALGKPLRSHGSVQDVTEARQVESRLRLAASVFDNANEGICITDTEQCIVDVNPTLCQLTGYPREELIGQTPRLFKSDRQDSAFYTAMWQAIVSHGHWRGELWNRHRNGGHYAVRLTLSAVRDSSGKLTHFIGIMVNITAAKKHIDQLERVAHFDVLTGIPNRLLLADRMRQAIAHTHRGDAFLAVCYLDLDEFKPVNDKYGHDTGDLALIEVAHRLNNCLRGGDTVARLGGDEFVLLLSDLRNTDEYETTLQRVLAEIKAPLVIDGHTLEISASIGIVLCPQHGNEQDALLRCADQAMYRAKQAGKNRWYLFNPDDPKPGHAAPELSTTESTQ
jgi:diguanylate cyclase (GGDEF)-like protein/PAS domain S-box-containing protein